MLPYLLSIPTAGIPVPDHTQTDMERPEAQLQKEAASVTPRLQLLLHLKLQIHLLNQGFKNIFFSRWAKVEYYEN